VVIPEVDKLLLVLYIGRFYWEFCMRVALMVEYDGGQYHGWQSQTGLRTVQQVLESALSQVASADITLTCAGRTDTGVHATGQIVHFDSEQERPTRAWIHGANSFLPKDVRVKWAQDMPEAFHARFSALSRRYRYVIYNTPIRPALLRSNLTWQYRQLDHRLMHEAGQALIGSHDFTSFRSIECQSKTPIRDVFALTVVRRRDLIVLDITANAFLHHMVRNIVGVLMAVGSGRKPLVWVQDVLAAKDRRMGAETAPPYGLYLVSVAYPTEFGVIQDLGALPFFLDTFE
jgi:tRNA pseudouridine38-40 synthase